MAAGIALTLSILSFLYGLGLRGELKRLKDHTAFLEEVIKHVGATNKAIIEAQKDALICAHRIQTQLDDLKRSFN